jgi:RimJ/RimL family protein N-acetyltransferase
MKFGKVHLTADIPELARKWRNQREVWRWCRQNTLISSSDQERWNQRIATDPTIKMFGIEIYKNINSTSDDLKVGVCGFTSISMGNRNAEFSLYIAPQFQGNGYGKDALKALLTHGFIDFGFKRIWGEVFDGNPAKKIFESLGMVHEGTLRKSYWKDGRFIDSHIVSMLNSEFVTIQCDW